VGNRASYFIRRLISKKRKTNFLLILRSPLDVNLTRNEKNVFDNFEIIELKSQNFSNAADSIISTYIKSQMMEHNKNFEKFK